MSQQNEQDKWNELKEKGKRQSFIAMSQWGTIDFRRDCWKSVVSGKNLSYDDFLELQHLHAKECRQGFELCYYASITTRFSGCIERWNKERNLICFSRILIEGIYEDGTGFTSKEDHVWMSGKGFEAYKVGDNLSFFAEVYRYLKVGHGKILDFALRNPSEIERIDEYEVPSDDDELRERIDEFICDYLCMYNEQCYRNWCLANDEWRESMQKIIFHILKEKQAKSSK